MKEEKSAKSSCTFIHFRQPSPRALTAPRPRIARRALLGALAASHPRSPGCLPVDRVLRCAALRAMPAPCRLAVLLVVAAVRLRRSPSRRPRCVRRGVRVRRRPPAGALTAPRPLAARRAPLGAVVRLLRRPPHPAICSEVPAPHVAIATAAGTLAVVQVHIAV